MRLHEAAMKANTVQKVKEVVGIKLKETDNLKTGSDYIIL